MHGPDVTANVGTKKSPFLTSRGQIKTIRNTDPVGVFNDGRLNKFAPHRPGGAKPTQFFGQPTANSFWGTLW